MDPEGTPGTRAGAGTIGDWGAGLQQRLLVMADSPATAAGAGRRGTVAAADL